MYTANSHQVDFSSSFFHLFTSFRMPGRICQQFRSIADCLQCYQPVTGLSPQESKDGGMDTLLEIRLNLLNWRYL